MEVTRIFDLPKRQLEKFPDLSMFVSKQDGEWKPMSTKSFLDRVNQISKGLIACGVQAGDKVGLISENRVEWNMIDYAIQQIGAVVVAIYPNISDNDYEYIFKDSSIKLCFTSNQDLYTRINYLKTSLPSLEQLYSIDEVEHATSWNILIEKGQLIDLSEVEKRAAQVKHEDLAFLIYTSGTTGKPKGVMLSHKNIIADVIACEYSTPLNPYDRALTFLPACHAYERTLQYLYVYMGLSIHFAESMDKIGENLKEIKPHIMTAVPRVIEKVYEKIMTTGAQLTGVKKSIFDWAVKIGDEYVLEADQRSTLYNIKLAIARKLVLHKWYEGLGGELKAIVTGSAAIQQRIVRVFLAAEIPIYEGYGLTEASPVIAVNCFRRGKKIGTVGPPLKGVEIKLADDGEILVHGDIVMMGYYNLPEQTAEVIKDGWLHTGDIGEWVDHKFLKIVDRKKEMYKTSGGKYIVPQQIEMKMVESPFIEQLMVVGEGEKFPGAFVVPSYPNLLNWAKSNAPEIVNLSHDEFQKSKAVQKKIEDEINNLNTNFGHWEQIKKIAIIPNEMTVEGGELTPTLKFKRKIILEKYKKQYQEIFG
ncbi:long-chain fatty acid--CoA ligase [Empedobacter stercoris]|uniref:AMP-dependent synthetase/ligase n=1 Tax=Empedobacter stercoris TaxID=1628248 RepID=UPI0016627C4D|nr:long-chain fatty acid--CoA ligase [Empedobacter stercoris]MCA4777370.1 long-chain fatty acid--CoA ligase [Empedobacter stercoris]MCA4809018.1 long-chain fatty acid--CoA ligase [Empedobacter stercoris]QNT14152.1 long-chain fatty acid--CoA ligase [Empedobacter stercoris]